MKNTRSQAKQFLFILENSVNEITLFCFKLTVVLFYVNICSNFYFAIIVSCKLVYPTLNVFIATSNTTRKKICQRYRSLVFSNFV